MKLSRVWAVLCGMVLLITLAGALPVAAQPQPTLPQSDLVIQTAKGPQRFRVELADNDQSRARGMMFRTSMAPDAGMLFDFKESREVSFWMSNTLIPLDMVFITAEGLVANIHANARPLDLTSIPSDGPVMFVLEIPGGRARELGLAAGDRVVHDRIKSGAKAG